MLRDQEIEDLSTGRDPKLIEDFEKDRLQPSSYDISVGNEYRFSHDNETKEIGKFRKQIKIPAYSLCYVLAKEKLNLPANLSASIHPKHRLVKEGMLMYPQPPIDPGYKGNLYLLLHNLTSEEIIIEKGEPIASIVFYNLNDNARTPYKGRYQNSTTLKDLGLTIEEGFDPFASGLKQISSDLANWRMALLSKWLPIIFLIITIIIAVLTIMFALMGTSNLPNPFNFFWGN